MIKSLNSLALIMTLLGVMTVCIFGIVAKSRQFFRFRATQLVLNFVIIDTFWWIIWNRLQDLLCISSRFTCTRDAIVLH